MGCPRLHTALPTHAEGIELHSLRDCRALLGASSKEPTSTGEEGSRDASSHGAHDGVLVKAGSGVATFAAPGSPGIPAATAISVAPTAAAAPAATLPAPATAAPAAAVAAAAVAPRMRHALRFSRRRRQPLRLPRLHRAAHRRQYRDR